MATIQEFDVTISAAGELDVSQGTGHYYIETFGGAPTDSITSIIGAVDKEAYWLWVKTPGHYWTLEHTPAALIFLEQGASFATVGPHDHLLLWGRGGGVVEVFRNRIFLL